MQQQQVRAAKFGAKLNYIKQLGGHCPEGYEIKYYSKGGQLCKECEKKLGGAPNTVAEKFKMESAKCGKKMKKKSGGGPVKLKKETRTGDPYEETRTRRWSDGTRSKMEIGEDGIVYTGRRGEVGITSVNDDRLNNIADSLRRADWSGRSVPRLRKRK